MQLSQDWGENHLFFQDVKIPDPVVPFHLSKVNDPVSSLKERFKGLSGLFPPLQRNIPDIFILDISLAEHEVKINWYFNQQEFAVQVEVDIFYCFELKRSAPASDRGHLRFNSQTSRFDQGIQV